MKSIQNLNTYEELNKLMPVLANATAMQIASTASNYGVKWNDSKNSIYTVMKVSRTVLTFDAENVLKVFNQIPVHLRAKGYLEGKCSGIAKKYAQGMLFRYSEFKTGTDTRFSDKQFILSQLELTHRNVSEDKLEILTRALLQNVQQDFLTVFLDDVLTRLNLKLFSGGVYGTPEQLDLVNMAMVDIFGARWIEIFETKLAAKRLAYSKSDEPISIQFEDEISRMAEALYNFYLEEVHTEHAMFQSKMLINKLKGFTFELIQKQKAIVA